MSETSALLVHGFAQGDVVAGLGAILGRRADAIVHATAGNGIVVLASPLERDDVDQVFETSDSVTALALDHASVLAAIAAIHDVVPLRLGTLVSGRDALADLCAMQAEAMRSVLDAIGGHVEFGVRIAQKPGSDGAPVDRPDGKPCDGRSYLRARALDRGLKRRASETQAAFCAALTDHLRAMTTVVAVGSPSARLAKGRLLDVACLVGRDRADDFGGAMAARIEAADRLSLDLEITGPWPPYSFVTEPLSGTH